jgi:hypothetical protein
MNKRKALAPDVSRRSFLHRAGMLAAASLLDKEAVGHFPTGQTPKVDASKRVAELDLDLHNIHKWDDSNGDTWDPFWADDDRLYAFNCDGRGFGKTPQNLAFNRFDGESIATLTGTPINRMIEYGPAGQHGKDNATWKACGQECIDGVFYAFVSRNVYGSESKDRLMRQTAFNSSLIKSLDRGHTWSRPTEENYLKPMWEGPRFGAPFFVHYGKNGGDFGQDGAKDFVYAVSTNGFWNDGDTLVLGRVSRKLLPKLDAADWEYFSGGDGADSRKWSQKIDSADPLVKASARCGQTPICYVPSLGIYLLISWYNPETLTKWFEPKEMRYDFFQAERPWGPWSLIRSFSDKFLASGSHMYGPALCARFQEQKGSEVRIIMFTSGCQFEDVPASIYKAWTIPVVLRTEALPPSEELTIDSSRIKWAGDWTRVPDPKHGDSQAQVSRKPGDTLTATFNGTGVACVAQKSEGYGQVEVFLDGNPQGRVNLAVKNFPALSGVCVFQRNGLPNEQHTLKLVNAGTGLVDFERLRIYR